jgi:drug/metabolite transporter (DMT)-like permease
LAIADGLASGTFRSDLLVNSIAAVSLLYFLLRQGEASRVATLFYLVPPITAAMGFAAFHETLGPLAVLGFGLAAAGVYFGARRRA